MKRFTSKLVVVVMLSPVVLLAQAAPPKPPAEVKALEVWVGDWTFTGTSKDGPNDKEHPLTWRLHGHWMLGGFIVQTDQEWIEDGVRTNNLEVLSYDPARKAYVSTGFGDDGGSLISTLTFKGDTWLETGSFTLPDGKTASFHFTWTFSPDHLSVVGTQDSEQDGSKWVSCKIKGTRAH